MRRLLGLTVLTFAVGLGAVVGYRMNAEAMAVILGVLCGVVASIPMSLLILIRRMDRQHYEERYALRREYPPIVVVNPGGTQQLPSLSSPPFPYPTYLPTKQENSGSSAKMNSSMLHEQEGSDRGDGRILASIRRACSWLGRPCWRRGTGSGKWRRSR